MSPSPTFNAAEPAGVVRVSVPRLPPMPVPADLVWICCNIAYEQRKRRCTVCKGWKEGKRTAYKKKAPQSVGTSSIASANTPTPSAAAPALEVNFTPTGAHPLSMSPMTGGGRSIAGSIDDSTAASTAASTTILETNDFLASMIALDIDEKGDDGDSDADGEGYNLSTDLSAPANESSTEQQMNDRDEIEDNVIDHDHHYFVAESSTENTAASTLAGAPDGWNPPAPKEGWVYSRKVDKNEPAHESVDNPGGWSNYTYKGKFQGKGGHGPYSHHEMPAGARPVPIDPATGKRKRGEWEFHYKGWKQSNDNPSFVRQGASKDNMFPSDRKAQLDGDLLKKMGLTKKRMVDGDALFFYQLIVPMIDPAKSGIDADPRQPFYTEVAGDTNSYAFGYKKCSEDYGHRFKPCSAEELVNWDGIVTRNLNSNVGSSWRTEHSNQYDEIIATTMSLRRWLDIKRVMKICDYTQEKKRGEPGYDPTQKYRKIWDVQVANLNQFIKKGGSDITIDETTWANASYADVQQKLRGKKVSKGGQHTLCLDAQSRYIYAYTPRHNYFERKPPFTAEGPAEIKRLLDDIHPLVKGQPMEVTDSRRQIFEEKMCFGFDNHFSGDPVASHLGERGYKCINTTRRDRLPRDCQKDAFHHIKQVDVNARSRMARFEQPIIAVKHVLQPAGLEKESYCVTHVSFQSTGSTNIQSVNALPEVQLYVREREKGRGEGKRKWGIEMNEGRELYLKLYGAVDKIDQLLNNWGINYICWRWWHAPMRHGKGLALCMAWQMYLECTSGSVDPDWKVDEPLSSPDFRQKMGEQMCKYRAINCSYPGDQFLRNNTRLTVARRKRMEGALDVCADGEKRVSYNQYLDAKRPRGKGRSARLCGDNLDLLKEHLNSFEKVSRAKCQVCGKDAFWRCFKCKKHCCFKGKSSMTSVSCCLDFHNDDYFGLVQEDRTDLFGEQKTKFKKASASNIKKNKAHILKLKRKYAEDMLEDL